MELNKSAKFDIHCQFEEHDSSLFTCCQIRKRRGKCRDAQPPYYEKTNVTSLAYNSSLNKSGRLGREGGCKETKRKIAENSSMRFLCSRVAATRRAEVSSTLEGLESDMAMDRYSTKGQCYGDGLLVIHGGCHCLMVKRMYVYFTPPRYQIQRQHPIRQSSSFVLKPLSLCSSSLNFQSVGTTLQTFRLFSLFPNVFFFCSFSSSRLVSSISLLIILVILTLYPVFFHYFRIKIKFC